MPRRVPAPPAVRRVAATATTLFAEARNATLMGACAAAVLALLVNGGATGIVPCTLLGGIAGAVIGVLIWIDAAELPEAPVPPAQEDLCTRATGAVDDLR